MQRRRYLISDNFASDLSNRRNGRAALAFLQNSGRTVLAQLSEIDYLCF